MELSKKVKVALDETRVLILGAPAAYHRIVYAGEDTQDIYRVGSNMVTAATVPLALGVAGDVYVVIIKITASTVIGLVAVILSLRVLIGLWQAYPLASVYVRNRRHYIRAASGGA